MEEQNLPHDHEDRLTRARLSLEGLSVGDAYGTASPYFIGMDPGHMRWTYTDDTVMAMAIVRVLRRHGRIEQDELAQEFVGDYLGEPHRGYGGGAAAMLREIARGRDWREVSRAAFGGMGSMGNGAAMRVAPLGAYFADDLERLREQASASAEITHVHPEALAGALAVALAASWAWRWSCDRSLGDSQTMLDCLSRQTPASITKMKLDLAREIPFTETVDVAARILGNGSTVLTQDTVPLTLWLAARHLGDFQEAIETISRAGGDRDTNCAIVGGIVVLSAGSASIPRPWLQAREFLKG